MVAKNVSHRDVRDARARFGSGGASDCRDTALDGPILEHLRQRFDDDALTYRVPPRPVTHGNDTTTLVLELEGRSLPSRELVLRIFRDPSAGDRARLEAVIQESLVGAGYPAAPVMNVSVGGVLGRPFILMECLDGMPLLARRGSLNGDGGLSISSVTTQSLVLVAREPRDTRVRTAPSR